MSRAASLFEQAWRQGVCVAAYELGALYERGVPRPAGDGALLAAPDTARAWAWYERGARAGEPHALARLADRSEEAAHDRGSPADERPLLLQAFTYCPAATAAAQSAGWPDATWKAWRYHRASLARRLARAGLMGAVAAAYEAQSRRYDARPAGLLGRLAGLMPGHDR